MFPNSTRILIVDDNMNMSQALKNQLATMGYENSLLAASGAVALDLIMKQQTESAPVGLILCDWHMRGMSGLEVLEKVRANPEWLELPFIMITAESDVALIVKAAQAGVSGYIVKPLSPATLRDKMEKAWKKHHPTP